MIRHRSAPPLALIITLALAAGSAHAAEIQKSGSEVFPGKFAVSVNPFGVQAAFDGFSTGGYKFAADFAANLKNMEKFGVWIGGGFAYGHPSYSCFSFTGAGCAHDIQLQVFVRITLEKLMKIPLVPYVQAGLGGDVLVYAGSNLGGAFDLRLGGGIHYYILKQLGLGVETNFTFGPGIYPRAGTGLACGATNGTCISFFGNWDFLLGGRFHF